MRKKQIKSKKQLAYITFIAILVIAGIFFNFEDGENTKNITKNNIEQNEILTQANTENNQNILNTTIANIEDIPDYTNQIYIEINNNTPYFTEEDYKTEAFEKYSELDNLGRCGVAYANICKEIM